MSALADRRRRTYGESLCKGCAQRFRKTCNRQMYCGPECQRKQKAATRKAAATQTPVEHKQTPLRPVWALSWDPAVVIGPPRPARVRRYSNGVPTPFQDDLAATADKGTAWDDTSAPAIGQANASPLAGFV